MEKWTLQPLNTFITHLMPGTVCEVVYLDEHTGQEKKVVTSVLRDEDGYNFFDNGYKNVLFNVIKYRVIQSHHAYDDYASWRLALIDTMNNIKHWDFDICGDYKITKKEAEALLEGRELIHELDRSHDLFNDWVALELRRNEEDG